MEQSSDGLGIRKVYATKAAMEADENPTGTNGKALRYGQLVCIYDSANADQEGSGDIYAWQKPGWLLMGNISNIYELKSEIASEAEARAAGDAGLELKLAEALAGGGIGTVSHDDLDLGLGGTLEDSDTGAAIAIIGKLTATNVYRVAASGRLFGLLVVTSSPANDVTEWYYTRETLTEAGALSGSHDTGCIYLHYRVWSSRAYGAMEQGWSRWETVMSSSSLADMRKEVDEDMAALTSSIEELMREVFPLELSTVISPSVSEYTGSAQEVGVSWGIKRKGEAVAPDALDCEVDGSRYALSLSSTGSGHVSVNKLGSTTITVSATVGGLSASVSKTHTQVYPCYFGFDAAASDVMVEELASTGVKIVATSPKGTYELSNGTTGHYLWLCVPTGMSIGKVTSGGFEVPMEAAVADADYGRWKCYRSSSAINSGDMEITIS